MPSSLIYDVITLILMTAYDSFQLDMIQFTILHGHAKFYHKRSQSIFELVWTNSLTREFLDSPF